LALTGVLANDRLICFQLAGSTAGLTLTGVRPNGAGNIAMTWSNTTTGALTPASGTYVVLAVQDANRAMGSFGA
jgi:hypothetical protein